MELLTLTLAIVLLIVSTLAWRGRGEIAQLKQDRNLAIEVGKGAYERGRSDGQGIGYERGKAEAERPGVKELNDAYLRGWNNHAAEMEECRIVLVEPKVNAAA